MLKKILLAIAVSIATMGFAFAQADVNKADQAALDGIKGIGPKLSQTIIAERKKNGNFKDWADFEQRVKGIGEKNSVKLSEAGLTVNGQSKPNAPAAASAKADAKKEAKPAAAETKQAKPEADKKAGKEAKPEADKKAKEGKADAKKDTAQTAQPADAKTTKK